MCFPPCYKSRRETFSDFLFASLDDEAHQKWGALLKESVDAGWGGGGGEFFP